MVTELGPLFRTTGHQVKTQGITPKSGLKRGDLEIVSYLADAAGSRNLVIDVSITYDRIGSITANPHSNGTLSLLGTPDAPLNEAANRKLNKYCTSLLHSTNSRYSTLKDLRPSPYHEIWIHVTVNTNFMEEALLIVSTGFAPGSIYDLTLFVHGYFAVCTSLDPVRSFWYEAFLKLS